MDAMSEASLVAALKAGNGSAAETLVRTYASQMLTVATRVVGDRGLAEDCVQEAFMNAFRKIQEFEERSSLKTWLHRIVLNQALMKIRSRKARAETSIDHLQPVFDDEACRIEQPWHHLATPDEILESNNRRALVLAKIEELPESYRIVLKLRDIEEMSTQEVAEILELSEGSIRMRLHRARAALKVLLEPVLKGDE